MTSQAQNGSARVRDILASLCTVWGVGGRASILYTICGVDVVLSVKCNFSPSSVPRHPLFPLLALLFEKCEQSTLSSDCITSASFDVDIENFVRCQEKEGKPFFSEDPELDSLVRYRCVTFSHF